MCDLAAIVGRLDRLEKLHKELQHLQDCKSTLQDIYDQCKGVQPDQVDPYTWLRVKILLGE